ncbi:ribosome maturation factor RimP [Terrimonas rubra]|uniref:Ribosome maturation factor RimP n=1 Tax=Terrimonas rubra TaxID=1035890 RepID=A0ABW6A463_9BACT
MNNETIISTVTQKLEAIIQDNPTVFLVDIKIKPTNNIKVFVDGDNGVGIDRLVSYNRQLYKQLEEMAIFPEGDFSLEVSSPGLSEPLKLHRQYVKNTGRFVEVVLLDGTQVEGKLLTVTGEEITLEEEKGKGKKKETVQHIIAFSNIKTTKIQIKF